MIGVLAISTDITTVVLGICHMEYIAVLNNYLEYNFYDNHTVNLSFQSTSTHFFHATVSMKCCVTFLILLAET